MATNAATIQIIPSTPTPPAVGQFQVPQVVCPASMTAVGVGVSIDGATRHVILESLGIGGRLAGAVGEVDENGFTGAWSMTAYAICVNPLPGLRNFTLSGSVDSRSPKGTNSTCPPEQALLGSTFNITEGGHLLVTRLESTLPPITILNGINMTTTERPTGFSGDWQARVTSFCANGTNII